MTRKDYILLASALNKSKPCLSQDTHEAEEGEADDMYALELGQWQADVEAIASVLAGDNFRFNRSLFTDACGHLD